MDLLIKAEEDSEPVEFALADLAKLLNLCMEKGWIELKVSTTELMENLLSNGGGAGNRAALESCMSSSFLPILNICTQRSELEELEILWRENLLAKSPARSSCPASGNTSVLDTHHSCSPCLPAPPLAPISSPPLQLCTASNIQTDSSPAVQSSALAGHSPADKSPAGHSSAHSPADKSSAGHPQSPAGHSPADKSPAGHSPADKSAGHSPADKSPADKSSGHPQSPAGHSQSPAGHSPTDKSPAGQTPTGQFPAGCCTGSSQLLSVEEPFPSPVPNCSILSVYSDFSAISTPDISFPEDSSVADTLDPVLNFSVSKTEDSPALQGLSHDAEDVCFDQDGVVSPEGLDNTDQGGAASMILDNTGNTDQGDVSSMILDSTSSTDQGEDNVSPVVLDSTDSVVSPVILDSTDNTDQGENSGVSPVVLDSTDNTGQGEDSVVSPVLGNTDENCATPPGVLNFSTDEEDSTTPPGVLNFSTSNATTEEDSTTPPGVLNFSTSNATTEEDSTTPPGVLNFSTSNATEEDSTTPPGVLNLSTSNATEEDTVSPQGVLNLSTSNATEEDTVSPQGVLNLSTSNANEEDSISPQGVLNLSTSNANEDSATPPGVLTRNTVRASICADSAGDDSSDDDLEKFFSSVRLQRSHKKVTFVSRKSLSVFVVSDSEAISEGDSEESEGEGSDEGESDEEESEGESDEEESEGESDEEESEGVSEEGSAEEESEEGESEGEGREVGDGSSEDSKVVVSEKVCVEVVDAVSEDVKCPLKENLPPPPIFLRTPHTPWKFHRTPRTAGPLYPTPCLPQSGITFWGSPEPRQHTPPKYHRPRPRLPLTERKPHKPMPKTPMNRPVAPHPVTTPSAAKNFSRYKDKMISELYQLFNETVFDCQLPSNLKVVWNKRLTTTAGFCCYGRDAVTEARKAEIQLSNKVVDSYDRVRSTLVHEMCHAATWLIDGVKRCGHGVLWKAWADKVKAVYPSLPPVTRCHSYTIHHKHQYKCVSCFYTLGRHSKSINLNTTRCPFCSGRLEYVARLKADGTLLKPRTPNVYARFVKEHYSSVKSSSPWRSHQEVMEKIRTLYKGVTTPSGL